MVAIAKPQNNNEIKQQKKEIYIYIYVYIYIYMQKQCTHTYKNNVPREIVLRNQLKKHSSNYAISLIIFEYTSQ